VRRHQVFFGQKLDGVGQRLQETVRAGPAGPDAALYVREYFSFNPLQVRESRHEKSHDDRDFDEAYDDESH
jgi:hypothetical protein